MDKKFLVDEKIPCGNRLNVSSTHFFIGLVKHMSSKNIHITESELSRACDYIVRQFTAHSWWPTEQPGEAKREFDLMKGSATSLNVWCEKWLDAGQCKELEKSIRA